MRPRPLKDGETGMKTNVENLIQISVQGEISPPRMPHLPAMPHLVDREGRATLVPQYGSIVLNVKVGDSAYGWVGDHINPGVSIRNSNADANRALMSLACVGNEAIVVSGAAKGKRGIVTGKSGRWAEQVICHFPADVMRELAVTDRILIRAYGTGLKVEDVPGVITRNLSPQLLEKLGCKVADGKLHVPVTATVPPLLFGAGLGLSETWSLSIQTTDPALLQQHGLHQLRLGDIVALIDSDSSFNHGYREGAVSIGVVSQTDSVRAGFGPGITVLMTAPAGEIVPVPGQPVNLAELFKLQ